MNEFFFLLFKYVWQKNKKQIRSFVCLFFGRIYGVPICLPFYLTIKDCKMYDDIKNGKCTECLKSTGEEATTREKPKTTDIPKLTDLLTTTNSPKTTTSNIQIKVILYKPCGCFY